MAPPATSPRPTGRPIDSTNLSGFHQPVRVAWRMRSMTRVWFTCAFVSGALLLSGCQTTDTESIRSSSGGTMSATKWREIPAEEIILDLPLLLGSAPTSARERLVDARTQSQEFSLPNIRSKFLISRDLDFVFSDSLFTRSEFERRAKVYFGSRFISLVDVEQIQHRDYGSAGYVGVVNMASSSCAFVFAGYRIHVGSIFDNDRGQPDTVLNGHYCDNSLNWDEFKTALGRVALVKDRIAFGVALGRLQNAATRMGTQSNSDARSMSDEELVRSFTDAQICFRATNRKSDGRHWETQAHYALEVAEARRRNLDCGVKESLSPEPPAPASAARTEAGSGDITERLATLKSLFDQGLITREDWEAKKREILQGL